MAGIFYVIADPTVGLNLLYIGTPGVSVIQMFELVSSFEDQSLLKKGKCCCGYLSSSLNLKPVTAQKEASVTVADV